MSDNELHYEEFAPTRALGAHVRCIWRMRGPGASDAPAEPIIPDGCAELVLNFGEPFVRHGGNGVHQQPRSLVAGQITRAVTIQPSGTVDLWGVRFHPWGAAPFFGISGAEMQDRLAPLEDVAAKLALNLQSIGEGHSERAKLEAIIDRLTTHASVVRNLDRRMPQLMALAADPPQPFTVRALARKAGLSVRRVQRLFEEEVGLSPKQVHRINRFQHALALRRRQPSLTWSAVAVRAGYHDHAHLLHDSRDIAGRTPAELARFPSGLTAVFLADEAGT